MLIKKDFRIVGKTLEEALQIAQDKQEFRALVRSIYPAGQQAAIRGSGVLLGHHTYLPRASH